MQGRYGSGGSASPPSAVRDRAAVIVRRLQGFLPMHPQLTIQLFWDAPRESIRGPFELHPSRYAENGVVQPACPHSKEANRSTPGNYRRDPQLFQFRFHPYRLPVIEP